MVARPYLGEETVVREAAIGFLTACRRPRRLARAFLPCFDAAF